MKTKSVINPKTGFSFTGRNLALRPIDMRSTAKDSYMFETGKAFFNPKGSVDNTPKIEELPTPGRGPFKVEPFSGIKSAEKDLAEPPKSKLQNL